MDRAQENKCTIRVLNFKICSCFILFQSEMGRQQFADLPAVFGARVQLFTQISIFLPTRDDKLSFANRTKLVRKVVTTAGFDSN